MDQADYIVGVSAVIDNALTSLTVYLSLVSGYLIVGYLAGRNLMKSQLVTITCLFVVSSLILSFITYNFFTVASSLSAEQGGRGEGPISYLSAVLLLLQLAGIFGAILFMSNTRK